MFIRSRRKGQSTLEYATLLACIVAALIIMQRYYNRAAQGKWKAAADQLGEQFDYGKTRDLKASVTSTSSSETLVGGTYSTNVESNTTNTGGDYYVNN